MTHQKEVVSVTNLCRIDITVDYNNYRSNTYNCSMSLQPNKKRKGDSISTNSASINSTNTNRVTSTSSVCVDSQKEKYSERGGETSNCADEDNSEEESINSEEDEEDEESDEDGDEIDGEIDLQDLARQFYLYALEQYEECTVSGLVNAFKAVEKSRSIVLEANEELATLLTKSLKRKLSDGKVPPGSSAVQRSLLDDRYLLCLCAVLSAKVMLIDDSRVEGGTNSSNSNNGNSIVKKLTEALVWFPRSIEANLLLAEEYRSNSVEVAHQQEAERLFLKALETGEYLMKTNKRKALKIGILHLLFTLDIHRNNCCSSYLDINYYF